MIDENEFFRNVTLRICGNLEIEEGLRACMDYISKHLPADSLYLERYDSQFAAMRVVARANAETAEKLNLLIPLDEHAKQAMAEVRDQFFTGKLPPVIVINNPEEEPVTRCLLAALGEPLSSAMSLPLFVEGEVAGTLIVLAEGNDRFNDDHIRLFSTLKGPFFVALSNALKHRQVVTLKDRLADDYRYLQRELLRISGDEIIGADFGLRDVMHQIGHVAPTDSPVLLMGETGVGKDVIANAIHLRSPRRDGPFIPVNCGAITQSLLDSELFGHEKGAFTGALAKKRGRFERADRGTIMLDEIGEMPLDAQVRLLRVLQHREIERVGGTDPVAVDIRVIAATNKNLPEMVKEGRFREDLWFRLNVFPITVPPLRERASDLPALIQHFIERKTKELKVSKVPRLAPGAIDALMAYSWPGNVRELENLIERAMILSHGESLRFDDLGVPLGAQAKEGSVAKGDSQLDLDTVIAKHVRRVLGMTGGKIHGPGGAGELLGMNPNTLRYKMRKLGISFGRHSRSK